MSSFISNRELVCKEHILLEELMLVKDHIKEFRENEGREYLKRTVHNEVSMDVIMEILRGRIESAVVRRYERKGYRLELLSSNIFVKTGEFSAEMNCEDNVVVSVSIYKDEKGDQK